MKMIIVIIKDNLREPLTRALTDGQYRVTGIASTGGFMRHGVTTLLIGVDESQVDPAIDLIRSTARSAGGEKQGTVYVVPVARFEQV
ncbi:MAG TPA: cyclic-di-AMP receptor [Anaerolineales bacterium]|nr:cyclic-di-AMP receptor [Anaerolineales bacterium]